MAETAAIASPDVTPYRFTVDAYYRMWAEEIFPPDARLELVEGQIVSMPSPGPPHSGTVDQLNQLFATALVGRAIVRVQSALRLNEWTELLADISLLKSRDDWYKRRQPTGADTFLVIEVSDSSLRYDRNVKVGLYAQYGVAETWIIDLPGRQVEVYRHPAGDRYERLQRVSRGVLSPATFPDVDLDVSSLC